MAIESKRDLNELRHRFAIWLDDRLHDVSSLKLSDLVRPSSSGFSNDTLFCDISYRDKRGKMVEKNLVMRIAPDPTVYRVFPFYDIPRQFDLMRALSIHSDVPMPVCLWKEEDAEPLGEPFYVMGRMTGDVPSDNPPYQQAGFIKDATPEQRRHLWVDGLRVLARIHEVEWRKAGLNFLAWRNVRRSAIAQHLDFYEAFLKWAACGRPQPVCESALRWLRANEPGKEPDVLSWGDARIGNQMFSNFSVVATFDWEMAAIGSPEVDLGWWLFVDQVLQRGNGAPGQESGGGLEGIPDEAESVKCYEGFSGHKVKNLLYYKIFAGLRFGCVMIRIMQGQVAVGRIPEELGIQMEHDNVVTQITAELLKQAG